jgi:hypothetical protein
VGLLEGGGGAPARSSVGGWRTPPDRRVSARRAGPAGPPPARRTARARCSLRGRDARPRREARRHGHRAALERHPVAGPHGRRRLARADELHPDPPAPAPTQKPSSAGTACTEHVLRRAGRPGPQRRPARRRQQGPARDGDLRAPTGRRAGGVAARAGRRAPRRSRRPARATASAAVPLAGCRRTADQTAAEATPTQASGWTAASERRRVASTGAYVAHTRHTATWRPAPRRSWRRRSPLDTASSTGRQRSVGSSTPVCSSR